jgi:hypothetical protein
MAGYNRTRRRGGWTAKEKETFGPPKGEYWVWHPTELICSPSWKAMGINARRFIDFLEVEHRNHAGRENGNLMATYDQLVDFGLSRSEIRPAIDEVVFLGLVQVVFEGGRWSETNQPSRYRLTFYARNDWSPATNEWKGKTDEGIKKWKRKRAKERKVVAERKRLRKGQENLDPDPASRTTVVQFSELPARK